MHAKHHDILLAIVIVNMRYADGPDLDPDIVCSIQAGLAIKRLVRARIQNQEMHIYTTHVQISALQVSNVID